MSGSLRPHGLQHAKLPCPSPSPRVCPGSYSLNWWCHQPFRPLLSSSLSVFSLLQHQGLFWWVSSLHQMAKVLELQLHINPSNACSGLISFKLDWFDLLLFKGFSRLFSAPQFESISSLAFNLLYGPTLISVHDYWKDHYCLVAKSCLTLLRFQELYPSRLLCPWDFPGKYSAISFSRRSSRIRDQTWVFCLADRFFTTKPPGKDHSLDYMDFCWQSDAFNFLIHCLGLSEFSFQEATIF